MIKNIYTPAGCRLLSKQTGIKISGLKKLFNHNIPEHATSMDITEIETDFGAGKKIISSYRTKNNTLIKRVTKDKNNNITEISEYNDIPFNQNKYREIKRQRFQQEQKTQNITEKLFVKKQNDRNIITRVKLDIKRFSDGSSIEKQCYEEFSKRNKNRKYIETIAAKNSNEKFIEKTILTNTANIEKLKNDPFLFIRNYNSIAFAKEIFESAKKSHNLENQKIKLKFINIPATKGFAFSNCISINTKLNAKKGNLVNTINHEIRHQYQKFLKKQLGFFNFLFGKIPKNSNLSKREIDLARKFYIADIFYNPNSLNRAQYYDNFLEIDARKYGEKALKEYTKSSEYLKSLFPNSIEKLFNI